MTQIPNEAKAYKTIGPWKSNKIPKMLLKRHNTKKGVWAKLEVLSGSVEYFLCDTDEKPIILTPSNFGVSKPQIWHYINPSDDAEIQITFYKIMEASD